MSEFYKIKVVVGKLSIELESHEKEWVKEKELEYVDKLFSNPALMSQLSDESDSKHETPVALLDDASITINEFYQKYISGKSFSRAQMSLFFLYYLEKIMKRNDIKTSDIKSAFKEIQFPNYKSFNFTESLNSLKRKGYLNKDGNHWKLTITGLDNVMTEISSE